MDIFWGFCFGAAIMLAHIPHNHTHTTSINALSFMHNDALPQSPTIQRDLETSRKDSNAPMIADRLAEIQELRQKFFVRDFRTHTDRG